MKITNRSRSISLPLPKLIILLSFVIVSACSDSSQHSAPPDTDGSVLAESSNSESLIQVFPIQNVLPVDNPESDSVAVNSQYRNLQYPIDSQNDDRPGLIVTGINSVDNQDPESPFLLSTSTFRLAHKTPGTGDGKVHMVVYKEAIPASSHIDFYQPPLNDCLLRELDSSLPDNGDVSNFSASGGSSVVINSPSGPWFTIARKLGESDHFFYEVDNELPGRLPAGATLSVQGDEFPNVPAYPIFEPEPIERLLPEKGQVVSAREIYSWVPGQDSAHVKINLLAYDSSGEFRGFAVTCWAPDDGQFEMPDNVITYIATSDLMLKARFSRVYARLDWVNGMVIHQHIEVAE
jgi:hypothetical protein